MLRAINQHMTDAECYPDKAQRVNCLLKTLSSQHRRELIHYFESCEEADTASLDTVVSHIADRMPSTNPTAVEVALHHTHLPILQERGWIDYDPREGLIRYYGKEDATPMLAELTAVFEE